MGNVSDLDEARRNRIPPPSPTNEYRQCAFCGARVPLHKAHGPLDSRFFCNIMHRNLYVEGRNKVNPGIVAP